MSLTSKEWHVLTLSVSHKRWYSKYHHYKDVEHRAVWPHHVYGGLYRGGWTTTHTDPVETKPQQEPTSNVRINLLVQKPEREKERERERESANLHL